MLARVASGLAASALRRRIFLLGPLIALALAGAGTGSGPTSEGTASPSPTPSLDPIEAAKRAILLAYEAEAVYKVDNLVYAAGVGDELEALRLEEPRVAWGREVIVQLPAGEAEGSEVVILRAPLPNRESLCICEVGEVEDAGLYYARAPARKKCPPFKPGMPGWVMDRDAGWAPTESTSP
jgi:hypothetical protein